MDPAAKPIFWQHIISIYSDHLDRPFHVHMESHVKGEVWSHRGNIDFLYSTSQELSHWGQDKMATIFLDDILKWIFLMKIYEFWLKISLKSVPRGQVNNIPAFVEIMAWCQPGDKPLSEPMKVLIMSLVMWQIFLYKCSINTDIESTFIHISINKSLSAKLALFEPLF